MSTHSLLRAPRRLDPVSREAWARLQRMHGPGERRAAVLALLLTPGSDRERRAWEEETCGVGTNAHVRRQTQQLPAAARLPALHMLVSPCATEPLAERQALLLSVRRVMCADGQVGPLDRLVWLVVRHWLAGPARPHRGGLREHNDLDHLPLALRLAIAQFSGYLARLVPHPTPEALVGALGSAWYDAVMRGVWGAAAHPPTCQVPDVDTLGRALHTLRELGWMHRPVLARRWIDAALTHPGLIVHADDPLPTAAEALWLACALLDTPLPPTLACHFADTAQAAETAGQAREGGGT